MTKLSDIKPNPKNPRKISDQQKEMLQKSLTKHGDLSGIINNVQLGRLAGGHMRIEEMTGCEITIENRYKKPTKAGTVAEGYITFKGEKFRYREVKWDEDTEAAAMLAANKQGGDWDNGKLIDVMKSLIGKIDMDLTGFSQKEIERMMPKVSKDGLCDENHIPSAGKKTKTEPGDIYELGPHRLVCGDSTNLSTIEKLLGTVKADMIFTDPPYNVAYEGKTKEALKIKNDAMSNESFYEFLHGAFTNALIATKAGGAIYICFADVETLNFVKAMTESGWLFKQMVIWVKNTMVMGRKDYHFKHEPILYGWKDGGAHQWFSDRKQTTVFECNKPNRNAEHPTMKPVELVEYFIGNSSPRGGVVLDLFGGSGTTLIACQKTERRGFLCELDPIYCDVIVNRYVKFTGNNEITRNGKPLTWKLKAD